MEFINNFNSINITDLHQQYFVSLWVELLNYNTIDSYRVRVMNAKTILAELKEVIEDRIEDDISKTNINFVAEEAERVITNDYICKKYYKSQTNFVIKELKASKGGYKNSEILKILHKTALLRKELEENYFELLINELEAELFHNKNTENIKKLTIAFTTELVSKGFSLKYLYNRKRLLTDSKFGTFKDRWDIFKSDIKNFKRRFKVVVKFTTTKEILGFKKILNIDINEKFTKKYDADKYENEFDKLTGTLVATISELTAPDPISATAEAMYSFSLIQDLVRYEFRTSECLIAPKVLIYDLDNANVFLVNSEYKPLGFVSIGDKARFEKQVERFQKVTDDSDDFIENYSKERLLNSFRYFRMSIDQKIPETKFLNCWIALEFLMKSGLHNTIIGQIVEYLPKLLVIQYTRKLLVDLSSNISRSGFDMSILPSIGIHLNEKNQIDKFEELYDALKDTGKVSIITSKTNDFLLKNRIIEIADILKDDESLKAKLTHHLENVKWNLQRIYRTRNKIVHSANINVNLIQLEANLSYYFTSLFDYIIFVSTENDDIRSIEDFLLKCDARYEFLSNIIGSSTLKLTHKDLFYYKL